MLKVMIAPVTPFQQNCSIVWDDETMEGTAVDPGGDFDMLQQAIDEQGIKVTKVLLTHGHVDHASAAGTMAEHYGVKIEGPHRDDLFLIEGLPASGAQVQFPGLQAVRARPLAGERRDGEPRQPHLRCRALPRPHAGPCRVRAQAVEDRLRRRRAVPGLDRPHAIFPRGNHDQLAVVDPRAACGRSATTSSSCRATARPRPSAGSARPTPTSPICCSTTERREMVERQRRAGLQGADRDAALDLAHDRQGEQLADQEFLVVRQIGHDDFEQIVDGAGDHVAGDHLGHGEHRVLEAAGAVVGMALDAHADEDGEAEADPRAIERRAIGTRCSPRAPGASPGAGRATATGRCSPPDRHWPAGRPPAARR